MKTTFAKLTLATLIAGSTLIAGTAEAATTTETKATTQYNALTPGMTIAQAAKVIYGKDYKKQLTKKGSSTVLKQKAEATSTSQGQKMTSYSFYNKKSLLAQPVTSLIFMTKKNDSVYRLTVKGVNMFRDTTTGVRESKMKLAKGAKIKTGMTEQQLDAILSGKGLGEWMGHVTTDMTSVQSKQELELGLGIQGKSKTYVFPTATKTNKLVMLDYNAKKKTYVVSWQESL
ncbi:MULTISPECIES: hypothetical protein [unclassified Exiguobacterium]|uniref:hypothetical protein n=1 Tax=unclassified Exiguobacterium TaxID=2644629 RepID=UPI001BE89C84|nr:MULTISPECIES: hypothetical protein [unclassified Exiguobacterium]